MPYDPAGKIEVGINWENGPLKEVEIRSVLGNPCQLKYGDNIIDLNLGAGEVTQLSVTDFR